MVKGIVILAPESIPTTVNVDLIWAPTVEPAPNNVLIVVPLKLIWVPIIVEDTSVPNVWFTVVFCPIEVTACWFCVWAAGVLIPIPVKVAKSLISATVHE